MLDRLWADSPGIWDQFTKGGINSLKLIGGRTAISPAVEDKAHHQLLFPLTSATARDGTSTPAILELHGRIASPPSVHGSWASSRYV